VRRHALFAAIALIFAVCAASAQTLTFPALTGRVVDDAGILDAATRAELLKMGMASAERELASFEATLRNDAVKAA